MPKQIKAKKLPKAEKANAILAILFMTASIAFGGVLIGLLSKFMDEESLWMGCVIFGCYAVYLLLALSHCIQGICVFNKQENYGLLFQSVVSGAAAFTAILNLQFMLVLLMESLGKESAAEKLIGSRTMDEFVTSQSTSWTLLICGMAAALILGIFAIVKLSKK